MSAQFGVFVPQGWRMDLLAIADPVEQFEAMISVAKQADQGPWDSIWVYDHFHTTPKPTPNSVFEVWTSTAALARETKNVNVGQMVGCNGYRNPALYAKTASTVDVMSHGRLYAGFGAGWYEHEWRAYGYQWTDIPERMGRFGEATEIVHKMWTEDEPVFDGKYYSIDKPINEPKSAAAGRKVPMWIGGGGEKVTLKLVAKYADACNVGGGDPEVIKVKLGILQEHCQTVGRDFAEITKSTSINALALPDGADFAAATEKMRGTWAQADRFADSLVVGEAAIRQKIDAVLEAGADYIIFYVPGLAYDDELLPRIESIVASYA